MWDKIWSYFWVFDPEQEGSCDDGSIFPFTLHEKMFALVIYNF